MPRFGRRFPSKRKSEIFERKSKGMRIGRETEGVLRGR